MKTLLPPRNIMEILRLPNGSVLLQQQFLVDFYNAHYFTEIFGQKIYLTVKQRGFFQVCQPIGEGCHLQGHQQSRG